MLKKIEKLKISKFNKLVNEVKLELKLYTNSQNPWEKVRHKNWIEPKYIHKRIISFIIKENYT